MFIADNNRPERNNVIPDELDDNFQFDNHITNDIGKVQIYDY
jgi:archaellum component FlaC